MEMIKSLIRVIAFSAVILISPNSYSASVKDTGAELLQQCIEAELAFDKKGKPNYLDVGLCIGFVDGFLEGHATHEHLAEVFTTTRSLTPIPKALCMPALSTGQIIRVILKYMRDNPEKLHNDKAAIVLWALVDVEEYRCED
jgi:hypothetical protein